VGGAPRARPPRLRAGTLDYGRMERLNRVAQHVGGDLVAQLSELGQLFRDGLLTHDEFGAPLPPNPSPPAPPGRLGPRRSPNGICPWLVFLIPSLTHG